MQKKSENNVCAIAIVVVLQKRAEPHADHKSGQSDKWL